MPKRRANGKGTSESERTADGRAATPRAMTRRAENGSSRTCWAKRRPRSRRNSKTAISESQQLDVSKAGTYTVASWVRTWYEVYAEPRIRPNTKAYYTNYIENHIIPGIGNISLDKLTTIQIQRFYNNLQKSGRVQRKTSLNSGKKPQPQSGAGRHTLLHNCLEQAVAERLILTNPAQGCKLPQLEKKEMKILPQEKIGCTLRKRKREWASGSLLSGTDHRPAERGTAGPPMDGLGR